MAEPHRSAKDRCAGKLKLACFQNDRFVERTSAHLVVFADEDAQEHGVARDLHGHAPFSLFNEAAAMWPSQTASRHKITERAILPPARSISPSRTSSSVCRLKEEKVV